jgi:SAM-dependent methyltransferase
MSELGRRITRRFARVTTNAVVRRPQLWRFFRGGIERQFDSAAPRWDSIVGPGGLAALRLALDAIDPPPARVLDLGTGTGSAALILAERFSDAEVTGADLSAAMLDEARRKVPDALAGRLRYERADASELPYEDGAFDLVTLANMIPFFDELSRVVAESGVLLFSYSSGSATPIYVPFERLRAELGRRGFTRFDEFAADRATALLARKRPAD